MTEGGQDFGTGVIAKGKLEVRRKSLGNNRKSSMRGGSLVNIPLGSLSSKRTLEKPKTDRFIDDGVRRTPHVERMNMVGRILSNISFKLGDV